MEPEHTTCPECGDAAEIVYRTTLPSTDGPVAHVKIRCAHGHWFFMQEQPARVEAALAR